jgi:hypothetical protein
MASTDADCAMTCLSCAYRTEVQALLLRSALDQFICVCAFADKPVLIAACTIAITALASSHSRVL